MDVRYYANPVYWILALIAGILVGWWVYRIIAKHVRDMKRDVADGSPVSEASSVWVVIKVIIIVAVFLLACMAGFTLKQSALVDNPRRHTNEAEQKAIREIMESEPVDKEDLRVKKEAIEEQREGKRHEKALTSFEKAMKKEEDRINERNNLSDPTE